MLNAWVPDQVLGLAAVGVMALLIAVLLAAGGPPADPRCTLPWC